MPREYLMTLYIVQQLMWKLRSFFLSHLDSYDITS